ncbi:peptidoglycan-binding domain-containing protein [Defluviimonas salinarum]|uniref:Peptidoglycan-binding protein n=1 Tax=Defluviimonas salinarum TaxID=2992147 RepID=A0ABT3J267_9RHOB|nr:peptidoglycan-binding domain-containing protein [Defluviimonas salinarum]MCW3781746.1 peptidoglycan-binding protein [Defluviimonas salinarum]
MKHLSLFAFAALLAAPAFAQDAALVIGNENYDNASDISSGLDALDAAEALAAAGFATSSGGDLTAEAMRALIAEFYGRTEMPGRSVILALGHFAHAGKDSWLLGIDADAPTLVGADRAGVPVATLLRIAAERPGGALVLLGTEERRIELGRGLAPGLGRIDIPQGVTVISGDAETVAAFAAEAMENRALSAAGLAERAEDLAAEGYLGTGTPLLPERIGPSLPVATAPEAAAPAVEAEAGFAEERAVWETARSIDSKAGYEAYLNRYPDGIFADAARAAIADLDRPADPAAQGLAAEAALRLGRGERRQIQRDLTTIGFDTNGVDGVFGRGSRDAIAGWQRQNGHAPTGYVTGPQMEAIAAQAAAQQGQVGTGAVQQGDAERLDRLFWEETGATGDEAGLRAYLRRYPDGIYADLARERLAGAGGGLGGAQSTDRADWDRAVRRNSAEGYRDYLAAHPDGAFAEDARQILSGRDVNAAAEAERRRAEQVEQALGLNSTMRSMVEQRLSGMGLKPGRADGNFDGDTRRAIRRYQQARGLPVTGYLSQDTVARILVDSF